METYLFGHDKMREVIYTEMGETQRRLFHRRAFAICEALGRPAAELALHAFAAGLTEQAVRLSLVAGDEAVRLLANAEASLHYGQALEALAQMPETADTQGLRVGLLLKLVQVSFMAMNVEHTLGRLAEAEAHLAESWQLLLSGEVLLEAARTQVARGLLCRDRGNLTSAQKHFEQAAARFETSGLTHELETVQSYLAQIGQS